MINEEARSTGLDYSSSGMGVLRWRVRHVDPRQPVRRSSTSADPLEPRLNQAFVEYAQARGFVIDPARVRSPQDKPRVERTVQFVRGSFFAGETFIDLADAQRRAEEWCASGPGCGSMARPSTGPLEVFAAEEQPRLLPAPDGGLRRADLRDGEGASGPSHRGRQGALLGARRT